MRSSELSTPEQYRVGVEDGFKAASRHQPPRSQTFLGVMIPMVWCDYDQYIHRHGARDRDAVVRLWYTTLQKTRLAAMIQNWTRVMIMFHINNRLRGRGDGTGNRKRRCKRDCSERWEWWDCQRFESAILRVDVELKDWELIKGSAQHRLIHKQEKW